MSQMGGANHLAQFISLDRMGHKLSDIGRYGAQAWHKNLSFETIRLQISTR